MLESLFGAKAAGWTMHQLTVEVHMAKVNPGVTDNIDSVGGEPTRAWNIDGYAVTITLKGSEEPPIHKVVPRWMADGTERTSGAAAFEAVLRCMGIDPGDVESRRWEPVRMPVGCFNFE